MTINRLSVHTATNALHTLAQSGQASSGPCTHQINQLHSVQQRRRDCVLDVGRGHKYHLETKHASTLFFEEVHLSQPKKKVEPPSLATTKKKEYI